jgi:hypothetical protein
MLIFVLQQSRLHCRNASLMSSMVNDTSLESNRESDHDSKEERAHYPKGSLNETRYPEELAAEAFPVSQCNCTNSGRKPNSSH